MNCHRRSRKRKRTAKKKAETLAKGMRVTIPARAIQDKD
jgi:hypothetical protein